jgi:hypothetical protein
MPGVDGSLDDDAACLSSSVPSAHEVASRPSAENQGLHNSRHRTTVEEVLDEEPELVEVFPNAGKIYGYSEDAHTEYQNLCGGGDNPFHPFQNEMEWEVAKWAKEMQTGDNTFTRLLQIPGVRVFLVVHVLHVHNFVSTAQGSSGTVLRQHPRAQPSH